MSNTLEIWVEIQAICEKAGIDPESVAYLTINPQRVAFEVYAEPKILDASTVTLTFLWART